MKFAKWIAKSGGPLTVALRLGVTETTVRYWLRGDTSPTARLMIEIVRLSKGEVTLGDILAARKNFPLKRERKTKTIHVPVKE